MEGPPPSDPSALEGTADDSIQEVGLLFTYVPCSSDICNLFASKRPQQSLSHLPSNLNRQSLNLGSRLLAGRLTRFYLHL